VGFQVGIAVLGEMLVISVHSNRTVVQLWTVIEKLPQLHWPTLAVSAGVVAVILGTHRLAPRLPGPLFAVVGAITLSASMNLAGYGIELLGPVAGGLPRLGLPDLSWTICLRCRPPPVCVW
jgi:MFS superfamily sulfate permease-like transporter